MLRKGRTRGQALAQFAGEWGEGGAGNAFSTANRRFAPLKMPFLPYSGGPTQSGGLKGRGQCEALRSPGTPGTALAWPVRKSGGPMQSGGLKGRGQSETLRSPGTPGTLSARPVRRSMPPEMIKIKNERAAALSNSLGTFSTGSDGSEIQSRRLPHVFFIRLPPARFPGQTSQRRFLAHPPQRGLF